MAYKLRQAIIFAGGRGERLRPLTDDRPKPMVQVHNRPFLEYLIELLKENGIEDVVLLVGYLAEVIENYFGDGSKWGMTIRYSRGAVDHDTGTRLRNAQALADDHFLLLYADNYWPLHLPDVVDFYQSSGALATTTVYRNRDGGAEYGSENNIAVGADGFVIRYDKTRKSEGLNGVDIGFFVINREVFAYMPSEADFSFERAVLSRLAEERKLAGFYTDHPYHYLTTPQCLDRLHRFFAPKKALFLDRDGVINKKMPPHQYVTSWKEFVFLPKAKEAISLLTNHGYDIYIVTNQRGISRGLVSMEEVENINRRMIREINKAGGAIAGVYVCPHGDSDNCFCRKPNPGMLYDAARERHLNLRQAILVGDDERDIKAGKTAGCRTVRVGNGKTLFTIARELV